MNRLSQTVLATSGVVLAAGAAAALAPVAATAAPSHHVVIHNCAGRAQTAPHAYTLFCTDGNDTLMHTQWKHWGAGTATATATDEINNCKPDCAAGHDHGYPVTVRLTDIKDNAYSRLTLTFAHRVPSGLHRTETFKLTDHGPVIL